MKIEYTNVSRETLVYYKYNNVSRETIWQENKYILFNLNISDWIRKIKNYIEINLLT